MQRPFRKLETYRSSSGTRLRLQDAGSKKYARGFTIVELLIVIVVIGILAAITIVAYNGIQARAGNAQTLDAVGNWVKGIDLYKVDTGAYPIPPSGWSCLGSTLSGGACAQLSGSPTCFSLGAAGTDAAFNTTMKAYLGQTLPATSSQTMTCGGAQYGGAMYYTWASPPGIYIFLKGNLATCPTVGGINLSSGPSNQDNLTLCGYLFPA
jgi:prepilin-type N-terminal cleavage/methylation domain-containing protein